MTTPDTDSMSAMTVETQEPAREGRGALANQVVDLALEAGVLLFHDEQGEPLAVQPRASGPAIVAIGSRDFERWLGLLAWQKLGRALGHDALVSARHVLASKALYEGDEHELHVRVARHEDAIWIDLDGRRAIRVTPGHWEIIDRPPILFRHFPHQRPLPTPRVGGDAWRLLDFVNLHHPADELLLLCYLVVAFVPDIPIAGLIAHGVQGSAKTTLLKLIKRLLDASGVNVVGGARNPDEFALLAYQHRALFFDNLSSLPLWLSDAMCRAITGDSYTKRTLYTDTDAISFNYRRLVGVSGIHNVADRADLLDRSVILSLAPISPDQRREEGEFWREFEREAGGILGGLLDALVAAMAIAPGLVIPRKPRMADFAHWGAAAAVALGSKAEEFLAAYARNVGRQNEAAIDGNPVAQAVLALMARQPQWAGTPHELLEELQHVADGARLDTSSKLWPTTPVWLTRRLREVHTNLLAMGVTLSESRTGQHRTLRLRRASQNTVTGVIPRTGVSQAPESMTADPPTTPNTVSGTVMAKSSCGIGHDAADANDGKSGGVGAVAAPEGIAPDDSKLRRESTARLAAARVATDVGDVGGPRVGRLHGRLGNA